MEPNSDGTITLAPGKATFRCSRTFRDQFLDRNDLSSRAIRAARRPDIDENEITVYQSRLQAAFDDPEDSIVLNADEGSWKVIMPPTRTITNKGGAVKIRVIGDMKAGFTIMGTISSDGERFPLFMIAKGGTQRCHKQLGVHPHYTCKIVHSLSGWMTNDVFVEYLVWIRSLIPNKKIHLVVDQFPAHFTPESERMAAQLNINLISVPAGGTAKYQPMDRRVFEIMTAKGAYKWNQHNHRNPDYMINKEFAAQLALECWEEIESSHILAAWGFAADESDDESGSMANSDPEYVPELRIEIT
jgi:hypothetical protein